MNKKIEQIDKKDATQYVGSIQLSDKVIVSDPCYDDLTWCQCVLDDVLAGNYKCFVKSVEKRIGELILYHEKFNNYPNEFVNYPISVDSGQAGFFDYEYFMRIKEQDEETRNKWYNEICDLTIKTQLNPKYKSVEELLKEYFFDKKTEELTLDELIEFVNIIYEQDKKIPRTIHYLTGDCKDNKCVVSSTGYGDGLYKLYIHRNGKGKIISMRIQFIDV